MELEQSAFPWLHLLRDDLPTPSSYPRIRVCMRSETLERVVTMSGPARLGTIGHRFLCNVLLENNAWKAAQLEAEEHREWLLSIDVKKLPA